MGVTIIEQDFPHDVVHKGQGDVEKHNKRVDEAVRKQLKSVISNQDIITGEGNKKVKVRLKYLDQYRFRHNPDRIDEIGRDQFDDLEDGEVIYKPGDGSSIGHGEAGNAIGEELFEAEYTMDELTDMMIEELELPDLDETKKNEITSDDLEYTDRRKRVGIEACLDKKQTLLANIKRKSQQKVPVGTKTPIIQDDLRYKTWEVSEERHSNAVIYLLMDRSASMWRGKIYAVKALYFWIVRFLRRKYDKVEIKFIAHDYTAKEMSEKEFFTIADSGGTRVSSAYQLCSNMIQYGYPSSMWDIYCFHASDGDSWNDEKKCVQIVNEILDMGANLFAYAEIDMDNYRSGESELCRLLKSSTSVNSHKILVSRIKKIEDVLDSLRVFLKQHNSGVSC